MKKILSAVFIVFGMLSLPVGATSVVQFSFDSLCETAKKIAHVSCVSSEVVEEADGIRTKTVFRVVEAVKGAVGAEIEIALPGGKMGGRHVTIAGMPSFKAGEETVLFLSGPDRIGSPWPVGLGQGCYHVSSDATSGRSVHLQRGATPIPEGALFKPAESGIRRVDLKAFLDKVRETVGVEAVEGEGAVGDGVK